MPESIELTDDASRNLKISGATQRVLVLGATGTAGKASTQALLRAGHTVSCLIRNSSDTDTADTIRRTQNLPDDVEVLVGDAGNAQFIQRSVLIEGRYDAIVSCMASRSGVATDAWAVDYQAHSAILAAASSAGIKQMVLLSAICVQRPLLEFQHAKLAFEEELINSGLIYSIVRPTAFFKSLSGQIERVRNGKPFLLFGDGKLTACKPISDDDLGDYMASCLTDEMLHNRILPIGGPGDAMTPREQGDMLFQLAGQIPRYKHVPVRLLDGIRVLLEQLGRFSKTCADKAELARIGRYYATESMLVIDPDTGLYSASATPSTGTETLRDYYRAVLDGSAIVESGEHSVFSKSGRTESMQASKKGTNKSN